MMCERPVRDAGAVYEQDILSKRQRDEVIQHPNIEDDMDPSNLVNGCLCTQHTEE